MNIYFPSSRGSALLVSLIILILVTIVTTVFLERIWGSAQTVQGIEASNAAYYQTVGIVEEQLIAPGVTKKTPWNILPVDQLYTSTGRKLEVLTGSSSMPAPSYGNSPYNSDYNIIALGQPVQIVIPDGINWAGVSFHFKVPQIGSGSTTISGMASSGIILWTLGYSGASLYASGETNIFRGQDINLLLTGALASFDGITNTGSLEQVSNFYQSDTYLGLGGNWGGNCAPYNCTLKLSMIRSVLTTDNVSLPFLEYKIVFDKAIPAQFMTLDSTAYSYGFQRTRTVRIPQITTNTALDFAVLQ